MKLLLKLVVSIGVGAVCLWWVLGQMDRERTLTALQHVPVAAIGIYLLTLGITHLFRAWRWKYLLRPIGVTLPFSRLLAISSVGFMAILALPVRLGEFVRPYLVVRRGQSRMSAVLGTVAVERIVDGLLISILFFGSYLASDPGSYSPELRLAAWLSLLGFLALTIFLIGALIWTDLTIRTALAVSFLPRLSPRLAERVADKLRALIQGFRALSQPQDLIPFLFQSIVYWGANGFGMWLLARSMNLDISLAAAYATMAFTGVVISMPNAPGLLGQFHAGIMAGLGAYLPASAVSGNGAAYAIALHAIQVVWYVSVGLVSWRALDGIGSWRRVVLQSNEAATEGAQMMK